MTKIRPTVKRSQWQLSKHAFYTAYHYALQYGEWVDELKSKTFLYATKYDGMPRGSGVGDPTERNARTVAELRDKIETIEETARETDEELARWILKAVTCEAVSYNYLRSVMGIPCGKNQYYNLRRKFYYLLFLKIKID